LSTLAPLGGALAAAAADAAASRPRSTHDATVRLLSKYQSHPVTITCFTQSCFPCVDRDHFTPLPVGPVSAESQDGWYPPGHGDLYRSLNKSGVLDTCVCGPTEGVIG
jgi:UTP--glucose-1-phosphate uridylyltransferase